MIRRKKSMDWFLYEKNLRHERVNIEIIHPWQEKLRFASLNITYFGWIISDVKQKAWNICLLLVDVILLIANVVMVVWFDNDVFIVSLYYLFLFSCVFFLDCPKM